jgi:beta-galactosidase
LNRDIAATFREGDFHYRLPLEQGGYTVTLTFVEPKEAADRSFNVLANGQRALQAFDVMPAAGGRLIEVRRSFEVTIGEEGLDLHFQPITGNAIVSGVEVVPSR